jgi:hypothetical protein
VAFISSLLYRNQPAVKYFAEKSERHFNTEDCSLSYILSQDELQEIGPVSNGGLHDSFAFVTHIAIVGSVTRNIDYFQMLSSNISDFGHSGSIMIDWKIASLTVEIIKA